MADTTMIPIYDCPYCIKMGVKDTVVKQFAQPGSHIVRSYLWHCFLCDRDYGWSTKEPCFG